MSVVYPSEYDIKKQGKSLKSVVRALSMRRERTKQTFKLQMLALVLALALLWYSINPAPSPVSRIKSDGELPDEKRRELEPQLQRADVLHRDFRTPETGHTGRSVPVEDEHDFEWPEFIDG